jgi:AraC-like DNA-binding protein
MDWRVKRGIDVMRCDYHLPLTVAELGRDVNLSSSRFTHLFRMEVGCSPVRYLRDLRLDTARTLAEETPLSVKEIMVRVGYNDPSHFARDFKRRHGASPRTFRVRVRTPAGAAWSRTVPMRSRIGQQTADSANSLDGVLGRTKSILLEAARTMRAAGGN